MTGETAVFRNLRERLFTKSASEQVVRQLAGRGTTSRPCSAAMRKRPSRPFGKRSRRMIPLPWPSSTCACRRGRTGCGRRRRIRELDPAIEIVMCTAFSDVNPADIGGLVPPEEKLSYIQKPFHSA